MRHSLTPMVYLPTKKNPPEFRTKSVWTENMLNKSVASTMVGDDLVKTHSKGVNTELIKENVVN